MKPDLASKPVPSLKSPVSARRRRTQRGIEAIEFGLFAVMMTPAMVWMFTTGMNFVRFNKANDVARAAALMYMKGTDMNLLGSQEIIQRVAVGLNLQVDDGTAPPNEVLSNSRGSGLVVLTQVQYVGTTTCGATSPCNLNKYVYLQRIYLGNRSLRFGADGDDPTVQSSLGDPAPAIWNSSTGLITNPHGDSRAQVSSNFSTLWTATPDDGQIIYVVESMFAGNAIGAGPFEGGGIYARVFM